MTEKEKRILMEEYEKDFFEKTGEKITVKYQGVPEYEEVQKYVNNYICKYNVVLGGNTQRNPVEADKIHMLRWYLKCKFRLTEKEIGYYTKCKRSNVYNSVDKVNNYLKNSDEKFITLYDLVMSEK